MTSKDPYLQREAEKYENPIASREHLLSIIAGAPIPPTFNTLVKLLKYTDEQQMIGLKRRLRAMENSGQLFFNKFKQYDIAEQDNVLTGKVFGHRDGYGFFIPEDGSKDLYISSHEMKRLIHGDIVNAILVDRSDRKGRKEVKILNVVQTRPEPIVGRYYVDHHIACVVPDDAKINHDILIEPDKTLGAQHGQVVVVDILQRPSKRYNAVGQVAEILGEHLAPGMEIEIALRNHDLPHQFSEQVNQELANIDDEVDETAKAPRIDLRELPLVTIDGEDARDFDDAVYCQPKKGGGWRLWVAIADVSYYVRPNTALDDEAIARGNSVYFPSQVIPMLPEKLSNGLCSLNPDVDRLCMVCEMTISAKGKLSGSKFYSALMRSKARLTYSKVATILGVNPQQTDIETQLALKQQYQNIVRDLEELNRMYQVLNVSRNSRGAIAFETTESLFLFNQDKKIDQIVPLIRNDAHKIIEECMILANVSSAKFIEKHAKPSLYRVHDKPSEDKYQNFTRYLNELGLSINIAGKTKKQPEPQDYCALLAMIADRPDQELIQTMLLRSMRQAVYQSDNIGHFGLALPSYSHFTSPIRRYPDLVVHRIIKAILNEQQPDEANAGYVNYNNEAVIELGEHCSMTERRADDATRDVADWLKCEYMQEHIGDTFTGVIATVTNFGLFVRLADLHIEGLIHITSLPHDYYHYDDIRMCLAGENKKIKYHVGDTVEVQVATVKLDEKKIDLILTNDGQPLKSTKGTHTGVKSKSDKKTKTKARKKRLGKNERKARKK